MKTLNLNPKFKQILETYGIDTDKCTMNSNGKIVAGSIYNEGNWSYSSSKEIAYQSTAKFLDEDEKYSVERSYQLQNGELIKLSEEII